MYKQIRKCLECGKEIVNHNQRDNHCHWCNNKENLHFHHTDYINNTGFTLCKQCHGLLHKGMMLGWA